MDGLCELAAAMRSKNDIKKKQIKLQCISQLPDGDHKTKLLLLFLDYVDGSSSAEPAKESEKNEGPKNVNIEDNHPTSRFDVHDLIHEE